MDGILYHYGILLQEVDSWFTTCLHKHADLIACRHGCSACCRGLFDITLLDALYLRSGFEQLPESVRSAVRLKAASRLAVLNTLWPAIGEHWLLNTIPESEWDDIMPEDDETPCILLSNDGACLVYDHRPMTCRLNGIPLIDSDGEELFDEWCTLNFVDQDPRGIMDLRYPFKELFSQELMLFREMTERVLGRVFNELDTLIPAAICMDVGMLIAHVKHDSQFQYSMAQSQNQHDTDRLPQETV
ncbi:MAG: YkgJ family cysteine cluster protein [Desulfuromonadales bacterium]|nr:YkgJ family cysteine cluster protein [Desulfuromonadales bacterium]